MFQKKYSTLLLCEPTIWGKEEMTFKRKIIIVVSIIIAFNLFLVLWGIYVALSILGPWDRPMFEQMNWEQLHVHYRLVLENNQEIHRDFIISRNDLIELKKLFSTKESRGMSIPCPDLLHLKLSNGEIWNIQFGTARTLRFCKDSDTYFAYHVELLDTEFHKLLRQICLENEQRDNPLCKFENISICTNRRHISFPDSSIVQAGYIEVSSRGGLTEVCVPFRAITTENLSLTNEHPTQNKDSNAQTVQN